MLTDLHRRLHKIRAEETSVDRAYGATSAAGRRRPKASAGIRFHCPVCKRWLRRFLPFGLRGRPNARCPSCGSLERHRFLWTYLSEELQVRHRRPSILHVAPEPCIQKAIMENPGLRYLGIDRYDDDADARQQDLTNLPYVENSFDLVLCSHVLEHIVDDRKAIDEMLRVLRPGGHAVILVPIDLERQKTHEDAAILSPADRLVAFGHPYHVRICGRDYVDRLRLAGFEVDEVHSTDMAPHRRRILRINRTLLYDCRKPAAAR